MPVMGVARSSKNDNVLVIAGRDRGKRGRVLRVIPAKGRVIVEGVNFIKRHTKAEPAEEHQGRHRRARGVDARVERAARLPGVRRADAHRPPARSMTARRVRFCRKCKGVVDK